MEKGDVVTGRLVIVQRMDDDFVDLGNDLSVFIVILFVVDSDLYPELVGAIRTSISMTEFFPSLLSRPSQSYTQWPAVMIH